ncbi:hypothetical protein DOM22_01165 [Bdellovibrio sp. ZAP7]|uniref:hypothetical protein n=1 Tax=Bdellovibrio sp. ZAP7 TaxID=2231053 RepID=UPI00115B44C4|nr:hypothetical protein [Bdellovibrio sp. ZAP7]QDK43868.1 hypothetical protein DOM22_01165 [Bdellovibrio sp. ZAP7]
MDKGKSMPQRHTSIVEPNIETFCATNPVIDKFDIGFWLNGVYKLHQVDKMNQWMELHVNEQIKSRKLKRREGHFINQYVHGVFHRVGAVINGNGIKYLRRLWEPLSLGSETGALDGNDNLFFDRNLVNHPEGLKTQLEYLVSLFSPWGDVLIKCAEESLGITGLTVSVVVRHFEIARDTYHEHGVDELKNSKFALLLKLFPEANEGGITATGAVRGLKVEPYKGTEFVIYKKANDVVRDEFRFKNRFLNKIPKNNLATTLDQLLSIESKFYDRLRGLQPKSFKPITMSTIEAVSELLQHCPKKAGSKILSMIKEGNGVVNVKCKDGAIYRGIRQLYKHGILEKISSEHAKYKLSYRYRAILNERQHNNSGDQ